MIESSDANPTSAAAPACIVCDDLDAAIADCTQRRGFRLDMIMPADAPRIALLSREGKVLRLETRDLSTPAIATGDSPRLVLCRAGDGARSEGRAGMHYRDLIPGRWNGRAIASLIRIAGGGPVPDYVHYHEVGFQMIFCRRGWVRVVYEDQGPPFVMAAGDCVLQPPTIRHRVHEASPGLEVVEVACPAEHATWREHALELPTAALNPDRVFRGQRFVHSVAAQAQWQRTDDMTAAIRDTGIAQATQGRADVRVMRIGAGISTRLPMGLPAPDFVFLYVLAGALHLDAGAQGVHDLRCEDACTLLPNADVLLEAAEGCEVLAVSATK